MELCLVLVFGIYWLVRLSQVIMDDDLPWPSMTPSVTFHGLP